MVGGSGGHVIRYGHGGQKKTRLPNGGKRVVLIDT
jgi:hypothetical protein